MEQSGAAKAYLADIASRLAAVCAAEQWVSPSISSALEQAFHEAFRAADAIGDDVTATQLLAALVRQDKVRAILQDCKVSVETLELVLPQPAERVGLIKRIVISILPMREIAASPDVTTAFARALQSAVEGQHREIGSVNYLLNLWDQSRECHEILTKAGGEKLAVRRYLAHGVASYASCNALEPNKEYYLRIHNDPYTTMEFVVEVLSQIYQVPQPKELMMKVHEAGEVVLGPFKGSVAMELVNRTHAAAAKEMFPLLVTVKSSM